MNKKLLANFIILGAALFFLIGLYQYINIRPQSIHQWRQTVCLNIALNFAEQDNSLLQPETNLLNADNQTTGIAQGEFPIFYYVIGKVWKLTGQQEWIYRISTLFIFLLSLYSIADALFRETKNSFVSASVPLLFFIPPVLAYYSVSFLMDGVALSTLILGWYAFYRATKNDSKIWLFAMFVLFTLTGLLKVTLLISVIALLSFSLAAWWFPKLRAKTNLSNFAPVSLLIILGLLINVGWYAFAIHYNNEHHGWVTENGIYPIWELTSEKWSTIVDWIANYWYNQYAPPLFYGALCLAIFFALRKLKYFKNHIFFFWVCGLTFLGSVTYVLLWIQVFHEHDYYVIALYPFFMMIVLFSIIQFWKMLSKVGQRAFVILISVCMIFGVLHTNRELSYRLTGWPNNNGDNTFSSYFDLEPFLRNEIGIDRYEKVVAYPDNSVCISLYLCDQKGWQMHQAHDVQFLQSRFDLGAKFVLVNDSSFYQIPGIKELNLTKIGQHKTIDILKVTNP